MAYVSSNPFAIPTRGSDNWQELSCRRRSHMYWKMSVVLSLLFVASACSNGTEGTITQDAKDTPRVEDIGRGEVCTPVCDGRVCGPDGCTGTCGACEMIVEVCSDEGQCVPAPCQSSLDCPSSLVCHKESGECVVCMGDEDCPEDTTCGADHECHKAYACDSDKDCKDLKMVCDKEAGLCVQCLGPEECAAAEYCLGGYCVNDDCVAGESKCEDGSVIACAIDGSAWQVAEVCGADQHCLEAACHDNICPPGESYCDDAIAKTCDELGSAVTAEEDCAADDFNCYDGTCTESVCPPNETFCTDDFTAAACAADGMSFTTAACPAKQYCDSGSCKDQVCDPSSTYCEANMVTICNGKGSAIQSKTDCGALVCVAGGCYELVCTPAALYCEGKALMECDANGTAAALVQTCGDSQYCSEDGDTAACQDQICVPGSLSCDGTTITHCDDLGAAWVPGTNCADDDKGCLDGECVTAYCGDGIKQEGEECDDGNDELWDGCTIECVSEGTGGRVFDGDWDIISDPGITDARTYSFWFKAEALGGTHGLLIKKDKPGGAEDPPAKPVKIYLSGFKLVAVVEPYGGDPVQVGQAQVDKSWTHVLFRVSPDEAQLLVDGVDCGSQPLPGASIDNSHDYAVGAFAHGGAWYDFFVGQVYGLQIRSGFVDVAGVPPCQQSLAAAAQLVEGEGSFPSCGE